MEPIILKNNRFWRFVFSVGLLNHRHKVSVCEVVGALFWVVLMALVAVILTALVGWSAWMNIKAILDLIDYGHLTFKYDDSMGPLLPVVLFIAGLITGLIWCKGVVERASNRKWERDMQYYNEHGHMPIKKKGNLRRMYESWVTKTCVEVKLVDE